MQDLGRFRQVVATVGGTSHGKSTWLRRMIDAMQQDVIVYKEYNSMEDKAFADLPEVSYKKYRGGKVRMSNAEIEYPDFLKWILRGNFKNGFLLIDDTSFFERDRVSRDLGKIMKVRRFLGLDIGVVFHFMTDFPIELFGMLDMLVMFNTTDEPAYKKSRIPRIDEILAAKDRISAQVAAGNWHYYEIIKMR